MPGRLLSKELIDAIYEFRPEWLGQSLNHTKSKRGSDIYFINEWESCCEMDSQTGQFQCLTEPVVDHIPEWWRHVITLCGQNIIGEPIRLIFGEWAGLYLMHIDRLANASGLPDPRGNMLFSTSELMKSAIEICENKYGFKITELVTVCEAQNFCYQGDDLAQRRSMWIHGGWPQLEINGSGHVTNWAETTGLTDLIFSDLDLFHALFSSYTCEQWACAVCCESADVTDLYHSLKAIKYTRHYGEVSLQKYCLCRQCQPHDAIGDTAKLNDEILEKYKYISAKIMEIKSNPQNLENVGRGRGSIRRGVTRGCGFLRGTPRGRGVPRGSGRGLSSRRGFSSGRGLSNRGSVSRERGFTRGREQSSRLGLFSQRGGLTGSDPYHVEDIVVEELVIPEFDDSVISSDWGIAEDQF